MGDEASNVVQGVFFVFAPVVRDPTDFVVGGCATQCFVVDGLAYGGLDQVASCQKDGA